VLIGSPRGFTPGRVAEALKRLHDQGNPSANIANRFP
jgi:hypothetical protein